MKKITFLLVFLSQIAAAQTPLLSLNADKGFSSTTWQDPSGINKRVTFSKATTRTTADGIYLDGNTNGMFPTAIPLSNFTIYMTVRVETMDRTLLGTGVSGEYGLHYQVATLYSVTEQPATFFTSNAITSNQKLCIALMRETNKSGDNMTLFVNGEEIRTFPTNRKKIFNLLNIAGEIGYQFKGWIKNIEIYDQVQTTGIVKTISTRLCPNPTPRYVSTQHSINATQQAQDGNQLVVLNNSLYSLGGWNIDNKVFSYVFKSDNLRDWTYVNDAPWAGRHTFGAGVLNNKAFVYGADFQNQTNCIANNDCWSTTNGVNWTLETKSAPFDCRMLYGSCVHNNNLYIIGGQKALDAQSSVFSVYKSNDGKNWQRTYNGNLAALGQNISGQAVSFNGKIWVVSGGMYDNTTPFTKTYSNKVVSSIDGTTWQSEPDFPGTSCQYANTVVYDNKLWFLFGNKAEKGNLDQIWTMDKNGVWQDLSKEHIVSPTRHATGVAVFKNRIVIVCGNLNNDCWSIQKI